MAALDVGRPTVLTARTPLDGDWLIALDPEDAGQASGWASSVPDGAVPAHVPGVLQESFPGRHGLVWYFHPLTEGAPLGPGERYDLRFDEVSYAATVWLDGALLGGHAGAGAFAFDVTAALSAPGSHLLAVRVLNPTDERIDGLVLGEVPHGNAALEGDFWPGRGYNYGGLTGPVEVRLRRAVEVVEVGPARTSPPGSSRSTSRSRTAPARPARWCCTSGSRTAPPASTPAPRPGRRRST